MIIDCHVHMLPQPLNTRYLTHLATTHDMRFGPAYLWNDPAFESLEQQQQALAAYHIDRALITYSANMPLILRVSGNHFRNLDEEITWVNEQMAIVAEKSGGQIQPLAYIDPTIAGAPAAVTHAVQDLHMPAVTTLTDYMVEGKRVYLDDPALRPFWKKVNQLRVPVFIHFASNVALRETGTPTTGFMSGEQIKAGLGQLVEDTLALLRIVFSGVLAESPHVRIVLGQLGGVLPFILTRQEMLYQMYANGLPANQRPVPLYRLADYLPQIYVDTHSMSAAEITLAVQMLGADHVVFGSDYPITPARFGRGNELAAIQTLDSDVQNQIRYQTVMDLLPMLKK
ncbi:amidohydrolase family protein [Schleiferilactobacillus perolens]|jgi:predicted TIM-barrel fold metal-dependent hydrolase|uniref:amidohydrolase family protein n=1 Tax=Schleiferilactobacillus perolens TaxID=100468 RepID=UPI0023552AA9|nr:amidohydrolase family protein [Schleiferilactobacillus perolens]MCI2170947.1 amidohydrolase family protein [Schleiferilactobacillus perolens]